MARWLEGTIVENIHWTENLFTLYRHRRYSF